MGAGRDFAMHRTTGRVRLHAEGHSVQRGTEGVQ